MRPAAWFALLGLLFFVPFLGGVHLFDWDEVNFAEISREMLVKEDYLRVYVNFQPFWEKPPFFFWLQALAMRVFGVGEFAARLPNALCGVITLVVLYRMGQKLYDERFGLLWAGAYFGSVLPFLYFKSGLIDPFFNLFIFLGLYFFILFYWKKEGVASIALPRSRWLYLFLGGFFVGMAILTKGQTAFILAALTMGVYWVYRRFRFYVSVPQFLFFTVAASLVTLTWYGLETLKNGPWFITEFNRYQYRLFSTPDAGHAGFPGYHFAVLLFGCFPASVFALRAFFRLPAEGEEHQRDFRRWMKFLFWVVLILFSIVRSKIVHYSSMCYFPLTFLAAVVMDKMLRGELPLARWVKTVLLSIGGLYALVTLLLPVAGMNIALIRPLFQKDPFALANLEADVRWTAFDLLPGLFMVFLLAMVAYRMNRGRLEAAFRWLYGGTAVFVMLVLIFFIGRIEAYSQRAAVEFFESKAGEDAYLATHGYKSYVQLFYGRVRPAPHEQAYNKGWLLDGPIDKDVYFATKIHRADELRGRPGMEEIGAKNGFVFFRRNREGK
jgi:4-amino-4-deoxy-L-arabinose transferase-like glycosyltransferase